ncbi:hypothetical protein [Halobacteriovorax sp. JY17]|uniref:hypothetical protein n=1 Tax=Halobacteriovorax sp. JY17 TaxID=2014617 RepID=UPI000C58EDEB|nr:hypothetical protein [Halobacteriovorax sp. JY17]PIK14828.1 MAG: hypothetical protein CES88_10860 [Halobacteriovorax sp. JY17]
MKVLISLFLLIISSNSFGKDFSGITSYSIGMVNIGVTENESSLESTDENVTPGEEKKSSAKAVSAISFNLNYEFSFKQKRSYFVKATVPMMTADGAGLFLGGVGFNWYLNDLGSIYRANIGGSEIVMVPKFRYWWGANAGVGYLLYNTESAKKSDIIFDLGIHGGAGYNFGEKWGMKGEAIVGRGTGVASTTMNIRMFFGVTYFI